LRRQTQSLEEIKKKLTQAEVKLRQITNTTLKDQKAKIKEQKAEIDVLKEMVKSSNTNSK
jgi:hypothetical protein